MRKKGLGAVEASFENTPAEEKHSLRSAPSPQDIFDISEQVYQRGRIALSCGIGCGSREPLCLNSPIQKAKPFRESVKLGPSAAAAAAETATARQSTKRTRKLTLERIVNWSEERRERGRRAWRRKGKREVTKCVFEQTTEPKSRFDTRARHLSTETIRAYLLPRPQAPLVRHRPRRHV